MSLEPTPKGGAHLLVMKFGGTSVGTPERIRSVADRIARAYHEGRDLVVVVSAMGHTTDELIELAHQVSTLPPHREMDMLLSAGERIAMALLSMALHDRSIPALSFTGSQTGIITDGSHRRARIRRILGDRVKAALQERKVAIVAGFQGMSEGKEITTLGRGGSDTTAVAIAAALGARSCEIYTDVDGVFSADPRVVQGARIHPELPHDLMVELATRGAGVLHSRSVELAKQFQVSLLVKNSLSEAAGTRIRSRVELGKSKKESAVEEFQVAGITSAKDKMLLCVELERPTVATAVFERAAQSHLSMIAASFGDSKMSFYVERDAQEDWKKHLQQLSVDGFVRRFDLMPQIAPISVVGDRFSQDGSALVEIIETLARSGISVTMGSASALAMTLAVPLSQVDEAVRTLHESLVKKDA